MVAGGKKDHLSPPEQIISHPVVPGKKLAHDAGDTEVRSRKLVPRRSDNGKLVRSILCAAVRAVSSVARRWKFSREP